MRLFLCEKPSQARDIARHLGAHSRGEGALTGNGVAVTWCIGHLLEQAPPEFYEPALKVWNLEHLPVLPQQWKLDVKPATKSQYQAVLRQLKLATEVVIATDADREGEVIAREVLQLAGFRGPVQRLWLSAMDDASVRKALSKLKPGAATLPLFYSGLGRARADWLAGMNLTMALTKRFGSGGREGVLHCGRVQTPVLALIVRRERQIEHFRPQDYFDLKTDFEVAGVTFGMNWEPPKSALDQHGHVLDAAIVEAAADRIRGQRGRVSSVDRTDEREPIPLLHSLGSLQREASALYGLKAQSVLDACQKLYEIHKATTYPRTDCEYLPASMHGESMGILQALAANDASVAALVAKAQAENRSRAFDDRKVTAHHAIIPTAKSGVDLKAMNETERLVYSLVRRRFIAQFLGDYCFEKCVLRVEVSTVNQVDRFSAVGRTPLELGWRQAITSVKLSKTAAPKEEVEDLEDQTLPCCKAGDIALNRTAKVVPNRTKPPRRYTEGTLLAAMESIDREIDDPRLRAIMKNKEKAGIGTDATRSAIIEGLFRRTYIEAAGKQLMPTARGHSLIGLIEEVAPTLADPVLTALWEEQLAQVEAGTLLLEQFEGDLGRWLGKLVEQIRANQGVKLEQFQKPSATRAPEGAKRGKGDLEAATKGEVPCERCAAPMRRIQGGKGWFWGCSAYKAGCRHTMNDFQGKPVRSQVKKGANTKTSPPAKPQTHEVAAGQARVGESQTAHAGQKCPTCHLGELIGRRTKLGDKPFLGCSQFPKCRHFQWVTERH